MRPRAVFLFSSSPLLGSENFWPKETTCRMESDPLDGLRFDGRTIGDAVLARVTREGFPKAGEQRNDYPNKYPGPPAQWQRVGLDFRLD